MKHTYKENIRCEGCANRVVKALSEHFEDVSVDVAGKMVTVKLKDESEILRGALALKKLGYPLVGKDSGVLDKAKSLVSCAIGKLS